MAEPSMNTTTHAVSTDTALEAVADSCRRTVLAYLQSHGDGPVRVEELVAVVTGETDRSTNVSHRRRRRKSNSDTSISRSWPTRVSSNSTTVVGPFAITATSASKTSSGSSASDWNSKLLYHSSSSVQTTIPRSLSTLTLVSA